MAAPNFLSTPCLLIGIPIYLDIFCFNAVSPLALLHEKERPGNIFIVISYRGIARPWISPRTGYSIYYLVVITENLERSGLVSDSLHRRIQNLFGDIHDIAFDSRGSLLTLRTVEECDLIGYDGRGVTLLLRLLVLVLAVLDPTGQKDTATRGEILSNSLSELAPARHSMPLSTLDLVALLVIEALLSCQREVCNLLSTLRGEEDGILAETAFENNLIHIVLPFCVNTQLIVL